MKLIKKIILKCIIPNFIISLFIFIFTFFSLHQNTVFLQKSLLFILFINICCQLIPSLLFVFLFSRNTTIKYNQFENRMLDNKQKTLLLEDIINLPFVVSIIIFLTLIISSGFILYYHLQNSLGLIYSNIVAFMECIFISHCLASITVINSYNICKTYSIQIVSDGVDENYIKQKKWLGTSIKYQLISQIIIPIVFSTIISVSIVILNNIENNCLSTLQIRRVGFILLQNILLESVLIFSFYNRINKMNKGITTILESMLKNEESSINYLHTDISDELAYTNYLSNLMFKLLKNILNSASAIGFSIVEGSNRLMEVSNDTESTAIEQSSGIKEIVATMQDSNVLSQNIESTINEVATMISDTAEQVNGGSDVLRDNLDTLNLILQSNIDTIDGIKNFNDKISSIWEVVNIINSIADQTKIIAFNAELETTNVHTNTKSFKNVANEIRRLANNTMDSTKEIKELITEIQTASDILLQSAFNSNTQIKQGRNVATSLDDIFSKIKETSKENSDSAFEIKLLISQETKAFEQILDTLKNISTEIENFSISTGTIIDTAGALQETVDLLDCLGSSNFTDNEGENDGYNIEV